MRKGILIVLLVLFACGNLSAQVLRNILINVGGKAQYKVSSGNTLIYLDDQGKILSLETDASGEVSYNKNFQPQQAGNLGIQFNYEGWLSQIGNLIIQYDHTGRIDKIGDLVFRYNYQQLISSVGNISIIYNANKTIDQIGVYKLYYNYSGKISRMDDSKGLIALQLNFSK
ncbi:hypothetical protein [Sediminibacterium sp. TEGAF015]|uniref:hypothetical protein n=1 Tax=Sediminibacterium sp. TEGAF015 TaxID=575378 RepID=UPI0021FB746A|nr:hypothetical protein [Sediminibacterium sp. TEGAF015]BDQ11497.1 hypothetical protein TEGAF0_07140 [Sediminibacterium sp. TEGAF015]